MKQTGLFKRLLSAVLFLALALSLLPAAQAEANHGYVVIPGVGGERVVNFRREPNTNDTANYPIARLPEYWVVEILGSEMRGNQRWYLVQANIGVGENDPVNYQTGYVMAYYIKEMTPAEEELYSFIQGNYFHADNENLEQNSTYTQFAPSESSGSGTIPKIIPTGTVLGYVFIITDNAAIYNEAAGSPIGFTIPKGTLVPYFEIVPFSTKDAYEWLRIGYDGNEGYIREGTYQRVSQTGYINPQTGVVQPTAAPVIQPTAAPAYVAPVPTAYTAPTLVAGQTLGMVTQDNVFFRKDMSTAGDFWARLPYGWTMTVLDVQTKGKITWYKVKGGTPQNPNRTYTGYIHGDYFILVNSTVTATPAPWYVPTGLPTAAPTAAPQGNTNYGLVLVDGVNMRQTPGGATVFLLVAYGAHKNFCLARLGRSRPIHVHPK